jgi:hypothetical protein
MKVSAATGARIPDDGLATAGRDLQTRPNHLEIGMGTTLWIHTLEGREMSKDSDDHSLMYDHADGLDALCAKLGVTALSSYFDSTDLEMNMDDGFDGDGEEDPETGYAYGIDDMKWFDAAAGLSTLKALRTGIAAGGLPDLDGEERPQLLEELDDCIARLEGTAARGGKFNLPLVM